MDALIITADDFGLAQEVNEAVEEAYRKGVLSAASLMVAGPAATHAIALAKRLPELRIGLHLVLVNGMPASPREAIPDLVDAEGALHASLLRTAFRHVLRPAIREQFAREISAQFAAFRRTGLVLDHVNAHEHFHVHPGLAAQILAIGRDYGMRALRVPCEPSRTIAAVEPRTPTPFSVHAMTPWAASLRRRARSAGLIVPDSVFGLRWSGRMTAARLAGLIGHLPSGVTEIYTHPAVSDTFPGHAPGYRYRDELAALTDPAVIDIVHARGLRPGGYSDAAVFSSRTMLNRADIRPAGTMQPPP